MTDPVYDRDGIRIYCGEALRILRSLDAETTEIHAVVTDPPYSSGGAFRGDRAGQSTADKYQLTNTAKDYPDFGGDNRDQRSFSLWCTLWLSECLRLSVPAAPLAMFSDWRQLPTVTDAIQAAGWVWRGIAVWDKTEGSRPARGRYRNQCEFIAWGTNGPSPDAGPCLPGLWRSAVNASEKLHTTGKPVEVMNGVCSIAWKPGSTILDPFCGSGSTLIAARNAGHRAIGIEISPEYVQVCINRLAQKVLDFA